MARAATRNAFRVIVSIIFIIIGGYGLYGSLTGGISADLGWILSAAASAVMLIAGILGIMKTKRGTCVVLGVITLIIGIAAFLLGGGLSVALTLGWIMLALKVVLPILYLIGVK